MNKSSKDIPHLFDLLFKVCIIVVWDHLCESDLLCRGLRRKRADSKPGFPDLASKAQKGATASSGGVTQKPHPGQIQLAKPGSRNESHTDSNIFPCLNIKVSVFSETRCLSLFRSVDNWPIKCRSHSRNRQKYKRTIYSGWMCTRPWRGCPCVSHVTGTLELPVASACAVSGSASASAPSCRELGCCPLTSSFTVYTNTSIYKGKNTWNKQIRALATAALTVQSSAIHLNDTKYKCARQATTFTSTIQIFPF